MRWNFYFLLTSTRSLVGREYNLSGDHFTDYQLGPPTSVPVQALEGASVAAVL